MQADLGLDLSCGLGPWGGHHFLGPDIQINFISSSPRVLQGIYIMSYIILYYYKIYLKHSTKIYFTYSILGIYFYLY